MPLELTIRNPDGRSQTQTIEKEVVFVGRRDGNDVVLPYTFVSGRHCRIFRQGGHLLVEDLGSTNGILINGDILPAKTAHTLTPEDVIQISTVELRARWIAAIGAEATVFEESPSVVPESPILSETPRAVPAPAPTPAPAPSHPTPSSADPAIADAPATMWEIQTGVYRSSSMQIDDHRVGTTSSGAAIAPLPAFQGAAPVAVRSLASQEKGMSGVDLYAVWAIVFQAFGLVTVFGVIIALVIVILS